MKRLYRTEGDDKKLCGVCGGLAEYFGNIDPSLVRIGWVVLTLASFGGGLLGYIVFACVVPKKSEVI